MQPKPSMDQKKLGEFCRNYRIKQLAFFGSVLREDFGPESDIDVLVEFEEETRIGFFGLAKIELELSELLNHKVDLRTPAELSRYFRNEVLRQAKVQYAQR